MLRPGALVRSGSLAGVTAAGRADFDALGVGTVIDLRDPAEVRREPSSLPEGVRVVPVPLFAGSMMSVFARDLSFDAFTRAVFDEAVPRMPAVVDAVLEGLGDPDGPGGRSVLVHCTAGKDRTGVAIALLLAAVGVPDEAIAADYALSDRVLTPARAATLVAWTRSSYPDAGHAEDIITRAPAPTMERMLGEIAARHGSAARLLAAHGVADARIAALREALVVEEG